MQIVISCTKGILTDTLETVNQVLQRVLPAQVHQQLAYLSGPSFAAEVSCNEAPVLSPAACFSAGRQQVHQG